MGETFDSCHQGTGIVGIARVGLEGRIRVNDGGNFLALCTGCQQGLANLCRRCPLGQEPGDALALARKLAEFGNRERLGSGCQACCLAGSCNSVVGNGWINLYGRYRR